MSLLSELTTLRLGGPARRIVAARSEDEVVAAVADADTAGEPLLVLAGGSNVVVADEGFPGTVVRMLTAGVEADGDTLAVQAGEPWDPLVERCVNEGLAGIECLSGIPGSVGATPIQNVGAYGQEVSETITSVRVHDRRARRTHDLAPEECGFTYRSSGFKRTPNRWVVLAVTYALERQPQSRPIRYPELARELGVEPGETAPLRDVREAVLRLRRRKGMVIDPDDPDSVSAGSFFTNPILESDDFARLEERVRRRLGPDVRPPAFPEPDGRVKTSAAWLVERAGFARGHGDARAIAVSGKHSLALTNRGAGTAAGLLALAREIADGVRREFGVELVPEPVLVGHAWAEACRLGGIAARGGGPVDLTAIAVAAAMFAPAQAPDCRSRAIGRPFDGRLACGVQLRVAAADYTTWDNALRRPLNRPWRRWGTRKLIRTTKRIAAHYRARFGTRLVIGDLSRPRGGAFGPRFGGSGHASHQNGLDVDIYFPRRDGLELPPFAVRDVDRRRSQWLVNRAARDAQRLFIGPRLRLRRPTRRTAYLINHDNHLHLRIRP